MELVAREPDADGEVVAMALEQAGVVRSAPLPPASPRSARSAPSDGPRRVARRVLAPVIARLVPRIANRLAGPVSSRLEPEISDLGSRVELVEAQMTSVAGVSRTVARIAELGSMLDGERELADQLDALTVNFELLKDEIGSIVRTLDDLSFAIAPGAGRIGVTERFAELRTRVDAIDRSLRLLADRPREMSEPAEVSLHAPSRGGAPFDYTGFEQRFRGDPEAVLATTLARYPQLLQVPGPVVDVGCGTGSLVASLSAAGISAVGVDLDPASVAQAQARGLEVVRGDAVEYLHSIDPGSLSAITAIQVVEHLSLDDLIALLEVARTRLRPGGYLIAETPNPTSLIVLGNNFILDPTHERPLHPSLLTFLCERAGFEDVRLQFEAPAESYHLPLLELDADAPTWAQSINESFEHLNRVLFGAQDYAAIATAGSG